MTTVNVSHVKSPPGLQGSHNMLDLLWRQHRYGGLGQIQASSATKGRHQGIRFDLPRIRHPLAQL
jgi:hypothetical protein